MARLILDPWQQEVMDYDGNIALRSSRQTGKSTVISMKAVEFCIKHTGALVLVVANTERVAQLLFEKALYYAIDNYKHKIVQGKDRPTKHTVNFTNGSRLMTAPTGSTGAGIRGFTVDLLICDEAAYLNDSIFTAISPMLAVTKGKLILLSTPRGKSGYFYDCFSDPNFKTWHITWRDCPRLDPQYIEREKTRMGKLQFLQEYEAEFCDELMQYFPTDTIKKCMTLTRQGGNSGLPPNHSSLPSQFYLGADFARMGADQSTFITMKRLGKDKLLMSDMEVTEKTLTPETINRIKALNNKWNYKKIYIDSGGMGAAIYDMLMLEDNVRRKLVPIDNSTRALDRDERRKRKLLKEDLYTNLLRLMEQRGVQLFDDPELELSLKSIQYEYINPERGEPRIKIFGNYDHIVEGLVRACWCVKDKSLGVWVA